MIHRFLRLLLIAGCALAADYPHQILTQGLGYFPVAIRLNNGDVLAVIRGGAAHIGVKGRLDLIRSSDGGAADALPVPIHVRRVKGAGAWRVTRAVHVGTSVP